MLMPLLVLLNLVWSALPVLMPLLVLPQAGESALPVLDAPLVHLRLVGERTAGA